MIKKIIKIAHLHVWDQKNKGDKAIVDATQELLLENIPDLEITDFPLDLLKKMDKNSLVKINQADLVIIGGGGIYYCWFLPYDYQNLKKIKKPIVIFGVGYIKEIGSKRLNADDRKSILELNRQTKLTAVRDYRTKKFLEDIGVPSSRVSIVGDPAIFLREKKISQKEEVKLNLNSEKIKIGVNLNYSGWLGFGQYEKIIIDSYRQTIRYFQNELNAEIYYLMHHPDEKNIIGKLEVQNLKIVNLSTRKQKYVYGKMDLIIGMMLHCVVLAFGAGTPEINVGYDLRNKSFARFINCSELVLSSDKLRAGELLKTAREVYEKRDIYKNK